MVSICKRFKFDAAHKLPKHNGRCHNLHGHRWWVDVSISGPIVTSGSSDNGMIMDFGQLKEIVNLEIINLVDHKYLNDELPFEDPTAENMSEFFFKKLSDKLLTIDIDVKLEFIRVWETEDAYAEWRA